MDNNFKYFWKKTNSTAFVDFIKIYLFRFAWMVITAIGKAHLNTGTGKLTGHFISHKMLTGRP